MTMTKRDFENLAKDLRWFRLELMEADGDLEKVDEAYAGLVKAVGSTCKNANTRFDRDLFETAISRPFGG